VNAEEEPMFWKEEIDESQFVVPDDVVDLIFKIRCPTLPVDHAWALSEAVHKALPWFPEEPRSGLHLIYGADSGNGWERPNEGDETLYLSRRTPLVLRLPKARVEEACNLSGMRFDIAGHELWVGDAHTRFLGMATTLYCRHVASEAEETEEQFLQGAVVELRTQNLGFKKVLCGKGTCFSSPQGEIATRSLMVAGLALDDAVTLQERGIGPLRNRGFGLFVPHKTV
jgi:CRISPR-associated protein Cas6